MNLISKPAIEFVIFGPCWLPSRAARTVMGFADGTILHPTVEGVPVPTGLSRLKRAVRTPLAWKSFDAADLLVVETAEVAATLRQTRKYAPGSVRVVDNTVNARFFSDSRNGTTVSRRPGETLFAYISRPYPHKNFDFLAPFVFRLAELGIKARVVVTLTHEEWEQLNGVQRDALENIGPVTIDQARSVYAQCDAALFPSLLECFSASPLEAMATPLPLYASDREFVRTICGEVPYYFDPLNPKEAADIFVQSMERDDDRTARLNAGLRMVQSRPSARDRAVAYLRIIESMLEGPDVVCP